MFSIDMRVVSRMRRDVREQVFEEREETYLADK
jgi:hypothetical protein